MNTLRAKLRATAVTLALASGLLIAPMAGPAAAGTCGTPFCGGVVNNNASSSIAITNCWDGGGYIYRETPLCMTNGWNLYSYNAGILLGSGSSSSQYYYYYDTDGFRVLHGCKAVVQYGGGGSYFTYDRTGYSTSMWVKISDGTWAGIVSYTC